MPHPEWSGVDWLLFFIGVIWIAFMVGVIPYLIVVHLIDWWKDRK